MNSSEKFIQLQAQIAPYKQVMGKAADSILEQDVSKYPIFVIHRQTIEIGIPIATPKVQTGKWSVNASTLEEFATKQLIQADKVDAFKRIYKDPEIHFCLFILSDLGANFAFIPRH